jgi:hypothetical protein
MKFDLISKNEDTHINKCFEVEILPKIQTLLKSSDYHNAKYAEIKNWVILVATLLLLLAIGGVIVLIVLIHVFFIFLIFIVFIIYLTSFFFFQQDAQTPYMNQREGALNEILRTSLGQDMILSSSSGDIYRFNVGKFGSFVLVEIVKQTEEVVMKPAENNLPEINCAKDYPADDNELQLPYYAVSVG